MQSVDVALSYCFANQNSTPDNAFWHISSAVILNPHLCGANRLEGRQRLQREGHRLGARVVLAECMQVARQRYALGPPVVAGRRVAGVIEGVDSGRGRRRHGLDHPRRAHQPLPTAPHHLVKSSSEYLRRAVLQVCEPGPAYRAHCCPGDGNPDFGLRFARHACVFDMKVSRGESAMQSASETCVSA